MQPHYVVITTGSAGDLFPFLKLALALHKRGHDVTFVAPSLHESTVRRTPLAFHGTVADPSILDHPDLWHPRRGFAIVWAAVEPGLRALAPLVARLPPGQPCVIVAHPLALAAAELCRAERREVRVVAVYLAPSNIPSVYDPLTMGPLTIPRWVPHRVRAWLWRRVAKRYIDPVMLPGINAARAASGLAPAPGLLELIKHGPDLSLTLFPEWFGAPQPDWPHPLVTGDFALHDPDPDAAFSAELVAFLVHGSPPIVFTPGTANQQAARYFALALEVVRRLDRRAIFLTPHRAQVPPALPPGVLWQAYVPLQQLLPHAAALVHHGGIGTTAEALRAGVPQLVVPLAFDQFDNAARIAALGAGLVLHHARLSVRSLRRKLEQLLTSPAIRPQAGALSRQLSPTPSLDRVLDAISNSISIFGKN